MGLIFQPTLAERFTPKEVKFSQLYKNNTQGGKLNKNILASAKTALRRSGYNAAQISKIITTDQPIPVKQLKQAAQVLNQAKIYGFEKDQDRAVKTLVNRERVKTQSIAGIRKEQIWEAAAANLAKLGTTSLNQRAIGPNTAQTDKSPINSKSRQTAARSLSEKSGAAKTTSLIARTGNTSIVRPGSGNINAGRGGIAVKPNF